MHEHESWETLLFPKVILVLPGTRYVCLLPQSLCLLRMNNQHGHWVCWTSLGGRKKKVQNTEHIRTRTPVHTKCDKSMAFGVYYSTILMCCDDFFCPAPPRVLLRDASTYVIRSAVTGPESCSFWTKKTQPRTRRSGHGTLWALTWQKVLRRVRVEGWALRLLLLLPPLLLFFFVFF